MSIPFSQGKLRGEERRKVVEAVQKHIQTTVLEAVRPVLTTFLEEEVTTKLGRGKGILRQVSQQPREIDWKCVNCGCCDANQFIRDGHYRRDLQTGWGLVRNMQVPMLECQCCKHDVFCNYAILDKDKRFWLDLDQDVLWSSGWGQSLREIGERWSATQGSDIGLRTINERINQVEKLAQAFHTQDILGAPDVLQLDGIWMTIQEEKETIKPDKRKRNRHEREGKRVVVLVALGFWQESGKREILDWQIATSEGHIQWQIFLQRLYERGVKPEKGLKAIVRDGGGGLQQALGLVYGPSVIDQRCIFHKLKNVADAYQTDLKGDERKEEKRQMMQEARAVYDAETAEQAKERLDAWSTKWRERATKSVTTFENDFDATIAYFQLEGFAREWIRSTSLLERVNRQLRRKFSQALTFGSEIGAEAALYLQVQRLHAHWTDKSWWNVSHSLYFDLDNP
jgi:putative transposase